jgi:hypothetical protein
MTNEQLKDEVKKRAENNILSEAYCLEMAQAFWDAAEIARMRRGVDKRIPEVWDDSMRNAV